MTAIQERRRKKAVSESLTVQAFGRVLNIKVTEDQNCLFKESSDSSERMSVNGGYNRDGKSIEEAIAITQVSIVMKGKR